MESHSVGLGLVPTDCEVEFLSEFESRFKQQCVLRPAQNGNFLAVYGRRRWPSGQRLLMSAFIRGYVARYNTRVT